MSGAGPDGDDAEASGPEEGRDNAAAGGDERPRIDVERSRILMCG